MASAFSNLQFSKQPFSNRFQFEIKLILNVERKENEVEGHGENDQHVYAHGNGEVTVQSMAQCQSTIQQKPTVCWTHCVPLCMPEKEPEKSNIITVG